MLLPSKLVLQFLTVETVQVSEPVPAELSVRSKPSSHTARLASAAVHVTEAAFPTSVQAVHPLPVDASTVP